MPAKKKAPPGPVDPSEVVDGANVLGDYRTLCGALNVEAHTEVEAAFKRTEEDGKDDSPLLRDTLTITSYIGGGSAKALVASLSKRFWPAVPFQPTGGSYNTLTQLRLNGCQIDVVGMGHIANLLRTDSGLKLERLELSDNAMDFDSFVALSNGLGFNESLKALILDSNKSLDCRCCSVIIGAIQNLTELSMANCSIQAKGCKAIAKRLCVPGGQLQKLVLSCNNLTPEGFAALCPGLEASKTLIELQLAGTGIGFGSLSIEQGGAAPLLSSRRSLPPLRLPWEDPPPLPKPSVPKQTREEKESVEAGFHAFKNVLKNNQTITHIDITANLIGNVCGNILKDVPEYRAAAETPILQFKVDTTLELPLLEILWIDGKPKSKGKKGKKKKKK
jgi:hypothetical protein